MALQLPQTAKDVTARAKVDVQRELQRSDPFVRFSYVGSIISGLCNRVFEFYGALREVEREANPLTAVRNLDLWASVVKVFTRPGAPAHGSIWVHAELAANGTMIPSGTRFVSSAGNVYVSDGDSTIGLGGGAISALSASAGVATATRNGHGLASNAIVTITGATQTGFNLSSVPVTVVSENVFTYAVSASLSGAATGSPVVTTFGASVALASEEAGDAYNLDPDAKVAFEATAPPNVASPAWVAAPGIRDGSDIEDAETKRARMLDRFRNPTAQFNLAAIRAKVMEIPGTTRVFVKEATPAVGQVTVYLMRDGDLSPIPDASEVAAAKAAILTIKPAQTSDADVIVAAPVAVTQNFTFSAISPSTASMKDAVRETLAEFFKLKTDVGVNVAQDAYRSAIFNTRDPVTGSPVASFTLTTPSGAITVTSGQIAVLGTVSI